MESKTTMAYDSIYEWAKTELKAVEGKKQDVIREAAKRLEAIGMPKNEISAALAKELEGYATSRYIRECLSDQYRREYNSVIKEIKSELVPNETINNSESVNNEIPVTTSLEDNKITNEEKTETSDLGLVDLNKFKESEKYFSHDKSARDLDYKQLYNDIIPKLLPFSCKTKLHYQGVTLHLLIDVDPQSRTATAYVDNKGGRA